MISLFNSYDFLENILYLIHITTMKIFAVGMNYAQHNKEIKTALLQKGVGSSDNDSERNPVIFTKADSSLLKDGKPFFVPDFMGRIDYETEVHSQKYSDEHKRRVELHSLSQSPSQNLRVGVLADGTQRVHVIAAA